MTGHQRKLVVSAAIALVTTLISLFGMAWFHMRMEVTAPLGTDPHGAMTTALASSRIAIDLRSVGACEDGICVTLPFDKLAGPYPSLAPYVFWISLFVCVVVALEVGRRLTGNGPSSLVSWIGVVLVALAAVATVFAAFVVPPGTGADDLTVVSIHRTWAPTLLVLGQIAAAYALHLAAAEEPFVDLPSPPVAIALPRAAALVALAPDAPKGARALVPDSIPLDVEAARAPDPFRPKD